MKKFKQPLITIISLIISVFIMKYFYDCFLLSEGNVFEEIRYFIVIMGSFAIFPIILKIMKGIFCDQICKIKNINWD